MKQQAGTAARPGSRNHQSIRWRLQAWYAVVLLAVIGGFAGVLYQQARATAFQRVDLQLSNAILHLDGALQFFPPHELDPLAVPGPGDPPPPEWRDRPPPDRERRGPPFPRPEDGREPPRRPPGDPEDADDPRDSDDRGPPPGNRPRPDRPPPPRPPPAVPRDGARSLADDEPRFDRRANPDVQRPAADGGAGPHPSGRPRSRRELYDRLNLYNHFEGFRAGPPEDQLYFFIWRSDGSVVKSEDAAPPLPAHDPPKFAPAPPGGIHFDRRSGLREARARGPWSSVILAGRSMASENAELAAFAWTLAFSGAVALVVGLAGGWMISARMLRPIENMSATAASISARNLSSRIDAASIDRELVGLAVVLNGMFDRLEASFERQRRFTSDASHELRTPLAILYTNLELAISRPRSGDEYRETLQNGLSAAGRMRTLVDNLLTLARADAGKLDLERRTVDLCEVVDDVVHQHAPLADGAGIRLTAEVLQAPVPVRGDAIFLTRIGANLVSNAIRHTPRGGEVRMALIIDDNQAVLSVTDTGDGIPVEHQPRIFERFYRVDAARSRSQGGNGLGLAICRSLVEAHDGKISFTSVPGEGCTFTVRLPLCRE